MNFLCRTRQYLAENRQAVRTLPGPSVTPRYCGYLLLAMLALTVVFSASAQAQNTALRWRKADAAGLAAWRVVVEEMPELAADAKKNRFNPTRDLRQANFDLNGDGSPEVFVSGTIDSFCGSAGCMTFVLTRGADRNWKIVCETYAQYGVRGGDIRIGAAGENGWRDFVATSHVSWSKNADGALECEERPAGR